MGHSNRQNRHRNNSWSNSNSLPPRDSGQAVATPSNLGQDTGPIGIPYPPDYIFKRQSVRQAPANDVWGQGTVSYIPERAEYIDGEGTFVYYRGVSLPSHCVAPVQAIYATNAIKRIMISVFRFLASREMMIPILSTALIGKKRRARLLTQACQQFISIGDITVYSHKLGDGYYCKLAKETRKFVRTFLVALGVDGPTADQTGELIGMMFEYDNAYRFRIQDLMGETSKEQLLANFPKEMARLLGILASRETHGDGGAQVVERFSKGLKVLRYIWYSPLRKCIIKAIEGLDVEGCRMDESDLYHTLLFGDYNVKGRTLEERYGVLREMHGDDMNKWPPRIIIRNAWPPNILEGSIYRPTYSMPFQKGHPGFRKKGTKNNTTLLKEERRALFDEEAEKIFIESIKKAKPEYILDQYLGKAEDKLKIDATVRKELTDEEKELSEKFNEFLKILWNDCYSLQWPDRGRLH